jgi:hypothetical protein
VEWSLHGPLPKLCPVIPTFNQDGRQAENRKKGNEIFKKCSPLKLLSQSQPNFAEMIFGWFPSKIVSGISDLPLFSIFSCAALLVNGRDHQTQFWKRTIQ